MRGKIHECQPENAEPITGVYFDEADGMPADGLSRWAWHVAQLASVGRTHGVVGLVWNPNGEAATWADAARVLSAAGFDIYDSDTMFETYPAGTVCDSCGEGVCQ